MKRRELIKHTFAIGAGLTLAPLTSLSKVMNGFQMPDSSLSTKVGVLFSEFESLDYQKSFIRGLQQSLPSKCKVVLSSFSNTSVHKQQLQTLIQKENLTTILSLSSNGQRNHLVEAYTNPKIKFLEISLGENVITDNSKIQSVNISAWQSNYAAGVYSAALVGKKAIVITKPYDAGFDCYTALCKGYTENSGSIVLNSISTGSITSADMPTLQLDNNFAQSILKSDADCILLHVSGNDAAVALNFLATNGITLPVVATYQTVCGLSKSYAHATKELITVVPSTFVNNTSKFVQESSKAMDVYAILGHMAGIALQSVQSHQQHTNTYVACSVKTESGSRGCKISHSPIETISINNQTAEKDLCGTIENTSGVIHPYFV